MRLVHEGYAAVRVVDDEGNAFVVDTFARDLPSTHGTRTEARPYALPVIRLRERLLPGRREATAWRLRIPRDHVVVHLGLAMHAGVDAEPFRDWVDGAHVVLAGFAPGGGEAFFERMVALRPKRLLLMDQTNDARRARGRPVEIVTPLRDRLVAEGIETHPFVTGVAMRFEANDTIKRW